MGLRSGIPAFSDERKVFRVKRFVCALLALCLLPVCAFALEISTFVDDYNTYAEYLFGISKIEPVSLGSLEFRSDSVIVSIDECVSVFGSDIMEVISSACCVLRCVDNAGDSLDQYARILHAYFLNRIKGKETRATTASGVLVFVDCHSGIYTIKVVK